MKSYQALSSMVLDDSQVGAIKKAIVSEARRTLVGRKFINVFGPLGAGVESISFDRYEDDDLAEIHLEGKADPKPIGAHFSEQYLRVPLIFKDFILHWRDVKWGQDMKAPIDAGNAALAAHFVAHREDDLIFNGCKELGVQGLLTSPGIHQIKGGDWNKFGTGLAAILAAIDLLQKHQHHFPYALALSRDAYSSLIKSNRESPVLELDQVSRLCQDGVFQTSALPEKSAVLVSTGEQNFDIAVAEDLSLAYLGPRDMNYLFRVYECLALRIKRPKAICVIKLD